MALDELLLIAMVFVLALFLIAFSLTLLYGLWNRKRDDRLKAIEERLASIEESLKSFGKR
jgi:type II secretory pathway pseudopilin PulG